MVGDRRGRGCRASRSKGQLGDVDDKDVLCLAGGGGQQSVGFALLGAHVTVLDLDAGQLDRDREAAAERGFSFRLEQGDMRDLGRFEAASFDVVWHPYSINFIPDIEPVVSGVARVLRDGGTYVMMMANPFASGIGTPDWNGEGYVLSQPYVDGAPYDAPDEPWVHESDVEVPPSHEYRHTLGSVVRTLVEAGLTIRRIDEEIGSGGAPGSWDHLRAVLPPWLTLWCAREPPA
jgi:SAM-dependent methyltransferase